MEKIEISYKTHHRVSGIYKIYWNNCSHFYYGQSSDLFGRKRQHSSELKRGIHANERLQNAYNKYGECKFECVELCDREELCEIEQSYIDKYFNGQHCCNLSPSANGVWLSEETKQKLSKSKSGCTLSESHRYSISQGLKKAYKDHRKHHFLGASKEENPFFNKIHSEDCKNRMSKKKEGMYIGAENPRARLVINVQTKTIYPCIKDAAELNCIPLSSLYKMISGDRPNKTNLRYL